MNAHKWPYRVFLVAAALVISMAAAFAQVPVGPIGGGAISTSGGTVTGPLTLTSHSPSTVILTIGASSNTNYGVMQFTQPNSQGSLQIFQTDDDSQVGVAGQILRSGAEDFEMMHNISISSYASGATLTQSDTGQISTIIDQGQANFSLFMWPAGGNPNVVATNNKYLICTWVNGAHCVWTGSYRFEADGSGNNDILQLRLNNEGTLKAGFDPTANLYESGSIMLGSATQLTLNAGEMGFAKITASGSAPGAAGGKIEMVCGTNAGSLKIIAYGGTSTTPVTVVDNIGSGATGC